MNQVPIYHPELNRHVTVPESAVQIHRQSGWIPADEYTPPADEQATPVAEEKKPTKAASRRTQAEEQ